LPPDTKFDMGADPSIPAVTDLDPLYDLESNKNSTKGGHICEDDKVCCIDSIESKAITWSFHYEGSHYTSNCPIDAVIIILFVPWHGGLHNDELWMQMMLWLPKCLSCQIKTILSML
jgi:hypothetical protein